MIKEYVISDLIIRLEEQKEEHGDIPVSLSSDGEGNNISPVGEVITKADTGLSTVVIPFDIKDGKLIIYPL